MSSLDASPWSRAMTLGEAISQFRAGASPGGSPPDPELADKWLEACAKGNIEKFEARLAWDGLTPADVPLLATMRWTGPQPDWVPLLEGAISHFEGGQLLPESVRSAFGSARESVPFTEVWDAFALAGLEHVPPAAATPEVSWFLSRRLAPLGAPILFAEFEIFRTHYEGQGDAYDAWLSKARRGGVREILEAFPVLARGLASITLSAAATLTDLLSRLEADRPALEEIFGPLGAVSRIDPGLSDRHFDGRQVARVGFSSGGCLIYKAKSVDLDAAFQRILAKLQKGADVPLPAPLRLLRRDGYGWVEHVGHDGFARTEEVEEYFRRGGGLLALVYALEGRDFIMDNLIATGQGPAAIDAEAALQPLCLPGGAEKMERAPLLAQLLKGRDFSVLDTGLVPLWMPGGKGFYDMSGLGGQTGYVSALQQEQWENIGTGAMACVRRPVAVEPEKNRVELRGEPQSASDYAGSMDKGFTEVYRLILLRRDEILRELESWKACQVRFLLRATNTYGQVLKRMLAAGPLTSGLLAGMEAEVLCRPFITLGPPPPIADFLREEVTSLQRWDVPCFHLAADGASHPYFLASPLVMARDRIGRMDEEDLAKQRRVLQTSLTLQPRADLGGVGRPHDPFPDLTLARQQAESGWKMPGATLISQAEAIAGILEQLPAPLVGPQGVLLYEGAPGPALLLAALGLVTGEAHYHERAGQLVDDWLLDAYASEFKTASPGLPIGAADGLASLPYACWLLGRLLGRNDLLDRAAELAGLVTRDRVLADTQLDLYSGAAGAAMVFSALAEATGGSAVFADRARWAMERLQETAIQLSSGAGVCWQAGGERYLGYGHGAAGIAVALLRCSRVLGDSQALETGLAALKMVTGAGTDDRGWPHLLRDEAPVFQRMESLCHGTPGLAVALAEARHPGGWTDGTVLDRLRLRLEALEPHPIDTLCCGNAGRLEALMALGSSPAAISGLLLVMLKRREPLGLFRTDFRRSDIYGCRPGLFRGLSGIGYQLLRLARPDILPSLSAWK